MLSGTAVINKYCYNNKINTTTSHSKQMIALTEITHQESFALVVFLLVKLLSRK